MTQQDVAAAVPIEEQVARAVAPWAFSMEPPDLSASHARQRAINDAKRHLDALSALQQRSGDERAALVQAVIRATEDGDHHPHISQWAAEQAVTTVLKAILGGQSCP